MNDDDVNCNWYNMLHFFLIQKLFYYNSVFFFCLLNIIHYFVSFTLHFHNYFGKHICVIKTCICKFISFYMYTSKLVCGGLFSEKKNLHIISTMYMYKYYIYLNLFPFRDTCVGWCTYIKNIMYIWRESYYFK